MNHTSHSSVPFFVVGAFFIVLGVLNVAKPSWQYRATRWQFKNPGALAPSDKALTVTRIAGVVAVIAGVVMLVVASTR